MEPPLVRAGTKRLTPLSLGSFEDDLPHAFRKPSKHSTWGSTASDPWSSKVRMGSMAVLEELSVVGENDSKVPICVARSTASRYTIRPGLLVAEDWGTFRIQCAYLITNSWYDSFICILALAGLVLVILETDARASHGKEPEWMVICGLSFAVLFLIEAILRVMVFRLGVFQCKWTLLDMSLVGVDLVVTTADFLLGDLPSVSFVRVIKVMRVLRFLRVVRTLRFFRELYMMLHGFVSALRAIVWATVLLFVMLTVWSIIAVELIHPVNKEVAETGLYENCPRCGRAYASVSESTLSFVQSVVAGDSWGEVALPVMERQPWTALIFLAVLVSIQLGLLNLILTVIVDRAAQARQEDRQFILSQRQQEFERARKELLAICSKIDEDQSGNLSVSELLRGFDTSPEFANLMKLMDISRDEITSLFTILDEDGSGDIAYTEFVEQLHKMKTQDSQMVLVFIKSHMKELKAKVNELVDMVNTKQTAEDALRDMVLHIRHKSGNSRESVSAGKEVGAAKPRIHAVNQASPNAMHHGSSGDALNAGVDARLWRQVSPNDTHPAAAAASPPMTPMNSTDADIARELRRLHTGVQKDLEQVMAKMDASLASMLDGIALKEHGADRLRGAGAPTQNPFLVKYEEGTFAVKAPGTSTASSARGGSHLPVGQHELPGNQHPAILQEEAVQRAGQPDTSSAPPPTKDTCSVSQREQRGSETGRSVWSKDPCCITQRGTLDVEVIGVLTGGRSPATLP